MGGDGCDITRPHGAHTWQTYETINGQRVTTNHSCAGVPDDPPKEK